MEPLIQVKLLETDDRQVPFEEWYFSIRDRSTRIRIQTRLDRLVLGNFGDAKSVGQGIQELRLQFGPGYRVYFAKIGDTIVILLGGGDKSSQEKDIEQAKQLWRKYKNETKKFERDFKA